MSGADDPPQPRPRGLELPYLTTLGPTLGYVLLVFSPTDRAETLCCCACSCALGLDNVLA